MFNASGRVKFWFFFFYSISTHSKISTHYCNLRLLAVGGTVIHVNYDSLPPSSKWLVLECWSVRARPGEGQGELGQVPLPLP